MNQTKSKYKYILGTNIKLEKKIILIVKKTFSSLNSSYLSQKSSILFTYNTLMLDLFQQIYKYKSDSDLVLWIPLIRI